MVDKCLKVIDLFENFVRDYVRKGENSAVIQYKSSSR